MLTIKYPHTSFPLISRGDFGLVSGKNICHGSDSLTAAKTEIGLWMGESLVKHSVAKYKRTYFPHR